MIVRDTSDWPREKIEPYFPAIRDAMWKLQQKFPHDLTVGTLCEDVLSGRKRLWLVLEDDGTFVSFAMTSVNTVDATGARIATLSDMAGSRVAEYADLLCDTLESWSVENNADFHAVVGLPGWERQMKKRGYKPFAVLWRKPVEKEVEHGFVHENHI